MALKAFKNATHFFLVSPFNGDHSKDRFEPEMLLTSLTKGNSGTADTFSSVIASNGDLLFRAVTECLIWVKSEIKALMILCSPKETLLGEWIDLA